MSENQTGQHVGVEAKIIHIIQELRKRYTLGKYEMAFHQDRYKGEAFYDRTLESMEDVGAFRVRFADKKSIDIPVDAIYEWDRSDFLERWGEAIMTTKR
ncbi:hypothetical protein Ctha_1911 [Chloroherpeton thalassium ATCC 35110]|uniref:Uncharacterized protein n=1 Tax=Chloroherpeton thalassium (strain ATCC 35110 / GB-78) TaxID=517418 RepID=B3QUB6_CHLT3|nr:hypothetical protein [Chloroherpeton thalassium]ACF14365.1 hypothetical protein Ctha_1911 [Chloroherpeton thalassium ATCC 35110]